MRVLVVGSGGREHALVWAISRSPLVERVLCAPGSDGIAGEADVRAISAADSEGLRKLCEEERIDWVAVGPEDPLADGLVDRLEAAGVPVFGPTREAAQIESSKIFAKEFMQRHGIPTADARVFSDPDSAVRHAQALAGPCVVKADGLAAGKAVTVCDGPEDARCAIDEVMRERRFGEAGARVLIEERLVGEEVSYYAISDGEQFVPIAAAQDHKRALDGDLGENTGGMGAYSPTPFLDAEAERRVLERVVTPALEGMRREGRPYRGVLYVGLMFCGGEPYVIEFNARFGDPETQAILPRLEGDIVPLLEGAARGRLPAAADLPRFGPPAVSVVLASPGYPRAYPKGLPIEGLDAAAALDDVLVFHSGTRRADDGWRTNGGRVLAVTARGDSIGSARDRAYAAAARIRFEGVHMRTDIAARALRGGGA